MRPISEVAQEADRFFMGRSPVHQALERIAKALNELEIPYAIAGCMAVNAHGHNRMTDDVDLLMTLEGLAAFKQHWLGRGWVEKFEGSKGLRDAVHNVQIDILLTGEYPGDGSPKPIAFPDPAQVGWKAPNGLPTLPLKTLIELKLASGITTTHRLRDLDDVQQLIRANGLAENYAESLDPFVRDAFLDRWKAAQVDEDY